MAVTREILVRSGLVADIGLASLAVISAAVLVPLALERLVRGTPFDAVFVRPKSVCLERMLPARRRGGRESARFDAGQEA